MLILSVFFTQKYKDQTASRPNYKNTEKMYERKKGIILIIILYI